MDITTQKNNGIEMNESNNEVIEPVLNNEQNDDIY
jgi:hypothetical protein